MATKRTGRVRKQAQRIVRIVEGQEQATSIPTDASVPVPPPADDPPVQQPSPSPELYTRSRLIETAIRLATTYQQQLYAAGLAQEARQRALAAGATDLPLISFPQLGEYVTAMILVERCVRDMGFFEDMTEFGRAVSFLILGPDQSAMDQQGG